MIRTTDNNPWCRRTESHHAFCPTGLACLLDLLVYLLVYLVVYFLVYWLACFSQSSRESLDRKLASRNRPARNPNEGKGVLEGTNLAPTRCLTKIAPTNLPYSASLISLASAAALPAFLFAGAPSASAFASALITGSDGTPKCART